MTPSGSQQHIAIARALLLLCVVIVISALLHFQGSHVGLKMLIFKIKISMFPKVAELRYYYHEIFYTILKGKTNFHANRRGPLSNDPDI